MTDAKRNGICISHGDSTAAKIADNARDEPVRVVLRHIIRVHLNECLQCL